MAPEGVPQGVLETPTDSVCDDGHVHYRRDTLRPDVNQAGSFDIIGGAGTYSVLGCRFFSRPLSLGLSLSRSLTT